MEQEVATQVVGLGGSTDFSLFQLFLRADFVVKGMEGAIGAKTVTYDFERLMDGAKLLKCSEFGDAIIDKL